jgi:hypothetical protein
MIFSEKPAPTFRDHAVGAFSGKVDAGFPQENATKSKPGKTIE